MEIFSDLRKLEIQKMNISETRFETSEYKILPVGC